jgi:hypothetical protein
VKTTVQISGVSQGWRGAAEPSPASLIPQAVYINDPSRGQAQTKCSCAMSFDEDALIDAHR